MKRWISVILAVLIVFSISGTVAQAQTPQAGERVEVWKRTDIVLISEKIYENPFMDVDIDAVFTHTDGTQIKLYGFWNGENEWRVRFSPTKTGTWSYVITCSDEQNTALNGVTGTIEAIPNTGDTAIDRHGFVRLSDNDRYFTYADGTPFYWLGDTNWQAPNYVSTTQCNYPDCKCENQFQHEVDDRLDKGFNVYQTYFDSGENDGGGQLETTSEPSLWVNKYGEINPDAFTEKIDGMFDYLAEKGMVTALGMGVHTHTYYGMGKENLDRISRYLTARYASYPVVWITGQEINLGAEDVFEAWKSSAEIVDAGDGYDHPQGTHLLPTFADDARVRNLDEQPWHEWWALQAGHGPIEREKAFYQGYWENENVKPYLETEANYEDITCGGFNGYDASRLSAWKANLLGSYGFTYGATGVWANNYSTAGNMGWYQSFSFEPWYMGIDKPGSYEMKYLRDFFEYVEFQTLIPRFNQTEYSSLTAENKVISSTEDASTYVAYFYNKSLSTGELRGLNDEQAYSAKWYNPRTGKFLEISDHINVTGGVYTIPQKPTTGDWALLVTSDDFGPYQTEQPYEDNAIDTRFNLAADAAVEVSSFNGGTDSALGNKFAGPSAVDSDMGSYWCAANGNMPQWMEIDLGEAKTFKEINIHMYKGLEYITKAVSYKIEGSLDGETWDELQAETDAEPLRKKNSDVLRVVGDGTYRYLRVEFSKIDNNWAAILEFQVFADVMEFEEDVPKSLAFRAGTKVSSSSIPANLASEAVDGNYDTHWCASSGNLPQWVEFDLRQKQKFNCIELSMAPGTTEVSYVLKGSNDEATWDTISTGTDVKLEAGLKPSGVGTVVIDEAGEYRYLRMELTDVKNNWATIREFEVYLNEGGEGEVDDTLPEYGGVLQTPVVKSAGAAVYSESGDFSNPTGNLMDGDADTVWKPYGPIGSQTIILDLVSQNDLKGVEIVLGAGATHPKYRIEGSSNGKDWTILADATLRDAKAYRSGGRTVISEALLGTYRYVKLLWLNGTSNTIDKSIAELKLYAGTATPAHPGTPDASGLTPTYYEWKDRNNGKQVYTSASWAALRNAIAGAGYVLANLDDFRQADVAEAASKLNAAVDALQEREQETTVDKEALRALYDQYASAQQGNYTDASWAMLQAALATADSVIKSETATQQEVDEALETLRATVDALEENEETPPVEKKELQALYDTYADAEQGSNTDASWSALQTALKAAADILADTAATQETVDGALQALKDAVVGLVEEGQTEAVHASPKGGTYHEAQQVTLTCETEGATIYYTVDGSEPNAQSNVYQTPIVVDMERTVKAYAEKEDMTKSPVTTFHYVITVPEEADKTELRTLYTTHKDKVQGNYTNASWAVFQTALSTAKSVLENEQATQAQIDSAYSALDHAVKMLKDQSPVDKAALQALYDTHKDKAQGNYTDVSWTAFTDALTEAKTVLENLSATQAEVDAAKSALDDAVAGLKDKESPVQADKSGLQVLYDANKDKAQGNYTDESWGTFTSALVNAKTVLGNAGATQTSVNNAKSALEGAIAGLTEKGRNVLDEIKNAPAGSSVAIALAQNGKIPSDALNAARGKDVNLVINYGSYSWTINGKSITGNIGANEYDLSVAMHNDAKLNGLAQGKSILQLEISHNGALPFQAMLRMPVGSEYEGKMVHLYFFDEGKQTLVYRGGAEVSGGNVAFSFTHCSKYVVTSETLSSKTETGGSGAQGGGSNVKTGDSENMMIWVLIVCISAAVIGGMSVYRVRKQKQNK